MDLLAVQWARPTGGTSRMVLNLLDRLLLPAVYIRTRSTGTNATTRSMGEWAMQCLTVFAALIFLVELYTLVHCTGPDPEKSYPTWC